MTRLARDPLYRRHRFPAEVIAHAVWLYFRFPLSLRMVEDMLAARGVIVSHQTVRLWAEKFGRQVANDIRRRSAGRLGDTWSLDEVVITIGGKKHWLWRAVDQDGWWRRLNGFERAVRTCFAYFMQRLSQRFHARSRWRECEAGDGLRRTTISGEEEKDWRSGRELRRNADIVART